MTTATLTARLLGGPPLGPRPAGVDVEAVVAAAGLVGRGGGGFPTARKLAAVRGRRRAPVLVANAAEGEPLSAKDATLLARAPHLVLEGIVLAARSVRAREAYLCLPAGSPAVPAVRDALLRHDLGRGGRPAHRGPGPVRGQRGVGAGAAALRRPGAAHLAAAPAGRAGRARCADPGAQRRDARERGAGRPLWTAAVPGGRRPGRAGHAAGHRGRRGAGARGGRAADRYPGRRGAGRGRGGRGRRSPGEVGAVLTGGYGGAWLPGEVVRDAPLTHAGMRAAGGVLGPGILAVLPPHACGLAETAAIARYLAGQSAGQCGPCVFGLPDIAGALAAAVAGGPHAAAALAAVRRWTATLPGRGACRHPDGAARLVASALRVFAADLSAHVSGRPCGGCYGPRYLEVPR